MVKSITINDNRFVLVSPEPNNQGLYPETGTFVFNATIQIDGEVNLQGVVIDQANHKNSKSRATIIVLCSSTPGKSLNHYSFTPPNLKNAN